MLLKILTSSVILSLFNFAAANDVLGCGGFLKSHIQIDFSRVVVKLYTKNGILKDQTNCAPNNGYYFIPLYEKGDYILKLEPPPGWSFNPTEINLSVDGKTDVCSQGNDINFAFKGFGITGKVESQFRDEGPSGVLVDLYPANGAKKATTSKGGDFFFTPVFPGKYSVSITHPRWKILKSQVEVDVKEGNTELPRKSLIIKGYDVVGFVKVGGEPVKNVHVAISSTDKEVDVDDCDQTEIPDTNIDFLCHVVTNTKGLFRFPCVSPGKYSLVPFVPGQNIHFQPATLEFEVHHNSVTLSETFEILGFSISGRVLDAPNGKPLAGARVILNYNPVGVTKADGKFILEKIQAGLHRIYVEADKVQFEEAILKIKPTDPSLSDLTPFKYQLCGRVLSEKAQKVVIKNLKTADISSSVTEPISGMFCEFLSPGKYEIEVALSAREREDGLRFFPPSLTVEVGAEIPTNITFSQLKATVSGKVKCITEKDCKNLRVLFRQFLKDYADGYEIIAEVANGAFKVDNVRPGKYEISLATSKLCWQQDKFTVPVTSATAIVPTFIQKGYIVSIISSHDTKVLYDIPGTRAKVELIVPKDRFTHCLETPGTYIFKMTGCHVYEHDFVTYDTTSGNNEIYLSALKHTFKVGISGPPDVKDLMVTVNSGGKKTHESPSKYFNGVYILELKLAPGDNVVLVPHSDVLYFEPPIASVTGEDDCVIQRIVFKGVKGTVFHGKVTPPLEGVLVTLESEKEALTAETDAEGKYKFPPQDSSKTYRLYAAKESYVVVGPDDDGDFTAHRLAEIVVQVFDRDSELPLQGALLSLSGGKSYRSNLQTNEQGKITFNSLSPSEYFLRPMMKEYSFEPSSKIIDIQEGETIELVLKGKRVAYSAFGQVTSLNGEGEEGITVIAAGIGNCSMYSEASSLEFNGNFRIRGLQPYCSYLVRTEKDHDNLVPVERVIPSSVTITNIRDDVFDIRFIIFRSIPNADILVKVHTEDAELYKTLRVSVFRESAPSEQVHTAKLDMYKITNDFNNGILLQIPGVPVDGKTYSVQIEPTLQQLNRDKIQIQYFVSNSTFKYIEIDYAVKTAAPEQHMKQTSVWTLLGLFSSMIVIYYIDFIFNFVQHKLGENGTIQGIRQKLPASEAMDASEIDLIVQSINAVKRKAKPKKI